MSDTAADDDDVRTATERVAEALTEQLQLSGERDRLKEQLLEQLHTLGWTANLFREAAVTTSAHQSKSEQSGSGSKEPSALTVQHLSELLAKKGHGTLKKGHTKKRRREKKVVQHDASRVFWSERFLTVIYDHFLFPLSLFFLLILSASLHLPLKHRNHPG